MLAHYTSWGVCLLLMLLKRILIYFSMWMFIYYDQQDGYLFLMSTKQIFVCYASRDGCLLWPRNGCLFHMIRKIDAYFFSLKQELTYYTPQSRHLHLILHEVYVYLWCLARQILIIPHEADVCPLPSEPSQASLPSWGNGAYPLHLPFYIYMYLRNANVFSFLLEPSLQLLQNWNKDSCLIKNSIPSIPWARSKLVSLN